MFTRRGFKRVMVLGSEGLAAPLREAGISVVPPSDDAALSRTPVDAVFVGWFPESTVPTLEAAVRAVRDGATRYRASDTPFFAMTGRPRCWRSR